MKATSTPLSCGLPKRQECVASPSSSESTRAKLCLPPLPRSLSIPRDPIEQGVLALSFWSPPPPREAEEEEGKEGEALLGDCKRNETGVIYRLHRRRRAAARRWLTCPFDFFPSGKNEAEIY